MAISDTLSEIKARTKTHEFLWGRCLTPFEIQQFEEALQIKLPEDFMRFLLEVGDGGMGINRLADMVAVNSALPFPLQSAWIWEEQETDQWMDPNLVVRQIHCHGQLVLQDNGCGEYWVLIVSGSQVGKVWNISDVGAAPSNPPASFVDWLKNFLDNHLQQKR
jgi:hypothetical protein